ncbi:MAG TPA: hypothetical protein PKW33_21400 [Anaerolineaceae bacterium]|nr:hypothetical protein [Anaerolineaceae bacterium]HPN54165.1 hypothetical protein [Anaerolineaceae bacterium]
MGRQIRFHTLPEDENQFIDFVLSWPDVCFIDRRMTTQDIVIVDKQSLICASHSNHHSVFIWPSSLPMKEGDNNFARYHKYDEEKMDYVETGETGYGIISSAPVIELMRSSIRDDQKLMQGRLWFDPYRLVGQEFVYKGEALETLYKNLSRWITSHFHREKGLDGYYGKAAWEWHLQGGEFFIY